MESATTQQEIIGLEKKYWEAMKSDDVETAVSLTKFPCLVAGPMGAQRVSESQYRKMMGDADGRKFEGIELENPEVDMLNDDAAMISYSVKQNGMNMLDVSTWVRENGKWMCVFHSENQIQ